MFAHTMHLKRRRCASSMPTSQALTTAKFARRAPNARGSSGVGLHARRAEAELHMGDR